MKVWKSDTNEMVNINFDMLFEEIYAGKFEIIGTGDLRYKKAIVLGKK